MQENRINNINISNKICTKKGTKIGVSPFILTIFYILDQYWRRHNYEITHMAHKELCGAEKKCSKKPNMFHNVDSSV